MATLEVNSHKINFKAEDHINLKSVLPKVLKNFPMSDYSIEHLKLNGKNIDHLNDDPELYHLIKNGDLIQVQISKTQDIKKELLLDIQELLDQVLEQIKITCFHLKEDEFGYSLSKLAKIIDAIDLLLQSMNHLVQELKSNIDFTYTPLKELQIHLLSVLRAISNAKSSEDYIMLTDLLEYELKDNLTQWKIIILPILKKEIFQTS